MLYESSPVDSYIESDYVMASRIEIAFGNLHKRGCHGQPKIGHHAERGRARELAAGGARGARGARGLTSSRALLTADVT